MAGNTAARVGSINVLLQTNISGAVSNLNAFAGSVERTGTRSARAVAGIDRSVSSLNRTMSSISPRGLQNLTVQALRAQSGLDQLRGLALAASAAFTGILPAGIAAGFVQVADRAHRMENSLRTVTSTTAELKDVQEALFEVSQRSRSSFESTVTLYARTARATEHLGLSQEKLLRITETVQKAFAIGGASPQEAQGAAIQLSQGIASDRFSGEEFRSVAENAPVLLKAMADSLGVGIGQLREMAHAGDLTAEVVTKAILDANAAIEASYAKTTSTIMQAVQMVDNELLKFVSNSSEASAASSAIVGILGVLGDNVANIAGILTLLAARWAAAFGARQVTSLYASTAAVRANRLEALKAAADANAFTQAQHKTAAATLASTRAAYEMAKANTVSASTRARLGKELQVALRNELATRSAMQQSAAAYSAATKAASNYGIALSGLRNAGSALMGFLGGPLGAALLALSGGMLLASRQAQAAEQRANDYATAIELAGSKSQTAAGGIRAASHELALTAKYASDAARAVSLASAQGQFSSAIAEMELLASSMRSVVDIAIGFNSMRFSPVAAEVSRLIERFNAGEISAEELRDAIDAIARANPENAAILARIQEIGAEADAARGKIEAMLGSLGQLQKSAFDAFEAAAGWRNGGVGEKGDRPPSVLQPGDFNSRFGTPYADPWKDIFPKLYEKGKKGGGGRSKRSADDRFDQSVQSVYDRIEALRLEREALSLTYYEQVKREEALKLEQEALKQAREEARQKGVADWQSVQISAAKRAEIDRVADAYAREALATKKAKEEQEAYKAAAADLGGILKGIADGSMELEDALIEMGKVLLKLLNDMNLAGGGRGIFGGGWLQSLIGGFLGLSFHGGGTVGAGGKMASIAGGAPYVGEAHEGRTIGRKATHKEVLALLEKDETVFTARDTGRIVDRLQASANGIGNAGMHVTFGLASDGALNLMPEVRSVARGEAGQAAGRVAKSVPAMVDQRNEERQTRKLRPMFGG